MIIGTITGNIVSTKKNEKLVGCKFMTVKTYEGSEIVALDNVGAGIGDSVIVTCGHNAVFSLENQSVPIDAVIIGIID